MKTVIGLFDTASDAFGAQNELMAAGIGRGRINVVTSQANKEYRKDLHVEKTEAAEGAGIGAGVGAVAGGAAGILASLGLLAIPGIGGLLAAGALATTLAGAGAGAVAGGLIGGLIGLGIPEDDAALYAEAVKRGGVLLTVDAEDDEADRVAGVLSAHNAVDIDQRKAEWETAANWRTSSAASTMDPKTRGVEQEIRPAITGETMSPADLEDERLSTARGRRVASARIYNP